MKKIVLVVLVAFLLIQCNSIKNHNAHLNDLLTEESLKSDVDYTYKKLQDLHPNLYWYSSKKDLDYKFDSLQQTITKPMTSFDFYKKLSPVVASVRQGHLFVYPSRKKFTKQQTKALVKKGTSPFSQFDFEIFNDKLYVIKNKSYEKSIKVGTEVVAINKEETTKLLKEYRKDFASDGFNETFKNNALKNLFASFYTFQNGLQDSVKYEFKHNDSLRIVSIERKVIDPIANQKKDVSKETKAFEKAKKKADSKNKSVYGYDPQTKKNNRNLEFIEKDSSVAVVKIRGFSNGNYKKFYKEAFSKIENNKSKTLILDLRNNGGGRIPEIAELYSYLADSTFVFLDKSEVASKTSLLKQSALKNAPLYIKIISAPFYYPFMYFSVHKNKDGKYYYATETKQHKLSKNAFKGKIYVLINGGSFSASSIISSNLQGSKRAVFVGEETGGAFNGTVAGQMPLIRLPNSKIGIVIGLMKIAAHHKTSTQGRGVFPDKEIIPTLEDRIKGNDPEMNWILNDIKANQSGVLEIQKNKMAL
jgi:C-terminal processing protease CtpA/Prc